MADRPRKSTRLTVSRKKQDYDALAELAVTRDVSLSWLIRPAVRQFINRAQAVDMRGEDILHAHDSNKD